MVGISRQCAIRRCRAKDAVALAAAVAGPLALYVATMPRTVVLEDDGLFLMAGEHLGVAHPPGYPVYTVLLHLFMRLPFGTPAFLGHLSSAVLGALACGAVFVCARQLRASTVPALTAALLFGCSEHVWSQAIITEVYSLNSLLLFSIYALLLHSVRTDQRHDGQLEAWLAAAVLYGISLANHWPLTVLATPGLLASLIPAWKAVLRRLPVLIGLAGLTAALPYGWMLWRSHQDPVISFSGPIHWFRSISDGHSLLFFLGRRGYSTVDSAESAGWNDRLAYVQWFGSEFVSQLTIAGFALALLGFILLLRERRHSEAGSGVLVFLAHSLLLIALLNFDFDYLYVGIFRPYSLACYGLACLWLAVGADSVLLRLRQWQPSRGRSAAWGQTAVAMTVGLSLAAWSVRANWPVNDRSASDSMERHADLLFETLPDNAILVVSGDLEVAPLGYFRFVEERRPDIELLSMQGLIFGSRLYSPFAPSERRAGVLSEFVNGTDRPVFLLDSDRIKSVCADCGLRLSGFMAEAIRGPGRAGTVDIQPVAAGEDFFKELVDRDFPDAWEYRHRGEFLKLYGHYLGLLVASGNPAALKIAEPLLPFAERDYHSAVGMISTILPNWTAENAGHAFRMMGHAERLLPGKRLTKRERSFFFYLKGMLELKRGNTAAATALFNKSLSVSNHSGNRAHKELRALAAGGVRNR